MVDFSIALRDVVREANAVFVSLQDLTTLVNQQLDRIQGLADRLQTMAGVVETLTPSAFEELPQDKHEISGAFAISHEAVEDYMKTKRDIWVFATVPTLSEEHKAKVTTAIARMYVLAVSSIHELAQQGGVSLPVTSKDLVASSLPRVAEMIESHRSRVVEHFGEGAVYKIGQEFSEMQREYERGAPLRSAIQPLDHRLVKFDVGPCGIKFSLSNTRAHLWRDCVRVS